MGGSLRPEHLAGEIVARLRWLPATTSTDRGESADAFLSDASDADPQATWSGDDHEEVWEAALVLQYERLSLVESYWDTADDRST